jgi:prepilin-type N-terminal cleavage/methylation domain-containing protein/prepilin-type processing-associated H-X9-DG protein
MVSHHCSDQCHRDGLPTPASRCGETCPGFTLIELLVVVALIVIIAGILFPVFRQARQATHRVRCLSNLRQLSLAHRMYVQDHDDILPHWYIGSLPHVMLWPERLQSYYRSPEILQDGGRTEAQAGEVRTADYALCAWGAGGNGTQENPDWLWPGAISSDPRHQGPMRLAGVPRPADTVQLVDGATFYESGINAGSRILRRHKTGMLNGVFLDGHARVVSEHLWNKIGRDERGYFYWIAAADR